MEKIIVVVFDTEENAYDGRLALMRLDAEGSIAVHAMAVVTKGSDGAVSKKQPDDLAPLGMVSGALLGSLIGVLSGPAGWAAGALTGGFIGAIADLEDSGISPEFVDEISKLLTPGKTALLAEVYEPWVTPIDTEMEKLGGIVLRNAWAEYVNARQELTIAAKKAEIAKLEAERAEAGAERKAKLQARIDELKGKMESAIKQANEKAETAKRERDAKVKALQDKAAKAQVDKKGRYDEWVANIRAEYEGRVKKLAKAFS
ncbi:DUF1269 domain-containing protein [Nitrospira sp. Nam74]